MPKKTKTTEGPGLTMNELERSVCACGKEDCDNRVIFFHGRCHPSAPAEVSYTKGSGKIVIACHECKTLIAEVAVAKPTLADLYMQIEDKDGPPS
jgi:hypothetical protein